MCDCVCVLCVRCPTDIAALRHYSITTCGVNGGGAGVPFEEDFYWIFFVERAYVKR